MLAIEGLRLVHVGLPIDEVVPPDIATFLHRDLTACAADDEDMLDAWRVLDRLVDGWLEGHGCATAVLAVCGDDELCLGVIDA